MNSNSDATKAMLAARHFETILRQRYRAHGSGLGTITRSVARNLPPKVVENLEYVATVRNVMVHEKVDEFSDKRRFEEACSALESFFRDAIDTAPQAGPSWIEECLLGIVPRQMASSPQKRLYTVEPGKVTLYAAGTHWIWKKNPRINAGYVSMLPQSLPRIELTPLRSKDGLELRVALDASAALNSSEDVIKAAVLNEEQQIETFRKKMLLVLQQITATFDFDYTIRNLHVVAQLLKKGVNENVDGDQTFCLRDCSIVECELEDVAIEEMRRRQQRLYEETKTKSEERQHATRLLREEQEQIELERQLAINAQRHAVEIEKLRHLAAIENDRSQQEFQKARVQLETELAVESSRREIEIRQNKVRAELEELEVVRAKAQVAATTPGKTILFPSETFGLDRLKLNRDAEFWRANFSDRKLQQFLDLAAGAGFSQAEVQSLRTFVSQMSNIALTERPSAFKSESESTGRSGSGEDSGDKANEPILSKGA